MWSKEVLASGLAMRVGDGCSIKTFEENWVPSLRSKVAILLYLGLVVINERTY